MTTHTKGPWQLGEATYGEHDATDDMLSPGRAYLVHDRDGNHIALVMGADEGFTEVTPGAANARLMAKAPELLERLRQAQAWLEEAAQWIADDDALSLTSETLAADARGIGALLAEIDGERTVERTADRVGGDTSQYVFDQLVKRLQQVHPTWVVLKNVPEFEDYDTDLGSALVRLMIPVGLSLEATLVFRWFDDSNNEIPARTIEGQIPIEDARALLMETNDGK